MHGVIEEVLKSCRISVAHVVLHCISIHSRHLPPFLRLTLPVTFFGLPAFFKMREAEVKISYNTSVVQTARELCMIEHPNGKICDTYTKVKVLNK